MIELTVADNRLMLAGVLFEDNDRVRQLANARWHQKQKAWSVPATPVTAMELRRQFADRSVRFDDGTSRLLSLADNLIAASWAKTCLASDLPPYTFKPVIEPWEHQRRGFWFAHALEAAMLAFDMGCGKTKSAIDLCIARQRRAVLVSCPTSVMRMWAFAFNEHTCGTYKTIILERSASVAVRTKIAELAVNASKVTGQPLVIIVNHQALWRDPFGKWVKSKDRPFDQFIFDESHRGKQHNGQLGGYIKDLWQHIPSRLALTGTPYPHDQTDIFSQFRMLDPGVFGLSWTSFKARYAVMGGYQGKNIVGVQNTKELQEKFELLAYRVESDDVLDIPEATHTFRSFKISEALRKPYNELERRLLTQVKDGVIVARNALVKLLRLQQLTSGYCKVDPVIGEPYEVDLGDEKIKLTEELLTEELPLPVVIFCRFKMDLARLRALSEKLGLRYGEVSGEHDDLNDDATMPDWIDVLGVQIQAGSLGINLTRAHVAVFYSVSYSLDDFDQCVRRLRRPGQSKNVLYVHLTAEDTVDEDIYQALTNRRDLIDVLLDRTGNAP